GLRADLLRIRPGPSSTGDTVFSADLAAACGADPDVASVPVTDRGVLAGADQSGGQTSDVGRSEILGIRASTRQRFAGGRIAVRWIPRLGRGRSNLVEAPSDSPGAANRAAGSLERCHCRRSRACDLRAADRLAARALLRGAAAQLVSTSGGDSAPSDRNEARQKRYKRRQFCNDS